MAFYKMDKVYDRILEKASRARIPVMSSFELLPVCNLNCKMCYVRKPMSEVRQAGGLKDAAWWLALAKDAADCGLLFPLLTGGEPLLHPQFREIFSGMLAMGLQVSINSNGTLIDRDWAEFFAKYRPTRINITLYGASEQSYQDLCGNGDAFRKVRQGVALLKEYGIPFKFNASITPQNVQDLEEMVRYAKELDAPIQFATYMFPPLRRDDTMVGRNERLSPREAALARVTADFLQSEPEWFVAQTMRYRTFVPLDQRPWEQGQPQEIGMRCRAGLCSLWVDWQGNFMNCGMYGSVKTSLEGKTFRQAWDEVVEQTAQVRYAPACLSCPNERLCHPCIAMVNNECGQHYGRPEYMCQMNQALVDYYNQFTREHYPDTIPNFAASADRGDDCEL